MKRDQRRKKLYRDLGPGIKNLDDPEIMKTLQLKYGISKNKLEKILGRNKGKWYINSYRKPI